MLGGFLKRIDGAFAMADLLKNTLDYQVGFAYYKKYVEQLNQITAQQINELAIKYFDPATMVEVVVGKK